MVYEQLNNFVFRNLNKKVVLITKTGLRYEGVIRDSNIDHWIELETRFGPSIISMSSIDDFVSLESNNESNGKMSSDRFKELLDELDGNSLQTLKEKNARYSKNGDCLHNFRSGSAITRKTPAQTCWGYMSKHLTSLLDKVEANDFSDREDFLEKCQDTINYIRFLWCIGNDENDKNKEKESK